MKERFIIVILQRKLESELKDDIKVANTEESFMKHRREFSYAKYIEKYNNELLKIGHYWSIFLGEEGKMFSL